MSEYIRRSQDVTVVMYHLVFPAKYRRVVFDEQVDAVLKEICLGVAERYQGKFLEIGTDKDHVHLLVQSGVLESDPLNARNANDHSQISEKFCKSSIFNRLSVPPGLDMYRRAFKRLLKKPADFERFPSLLHVVM